MGRDVPPPVCGAQRRGLRADDAPRKAQGLDVGLIRTIVRHGSPLWVGGDRGAALELPGLASDLPEPLRPVNGGANAAVDRDGVLWFVTERGLARVDPRAIVRNTA